MTTLVEAVTTTSAEEAGSSTAAAAAAAESASLTAEVIAAPESLPVTPVASVSVVSVSVSESADIMAISRQIRRALECPICLTLMSVMSFFCPNGHAVCQSCMMTLLNTNDTNDTRCPLCRTSMERTTGMSAMAVKLAEVTQLVKVACSNWPYGCTEMVPVRNVNEHESGCWYLPDVPCQVSVCQWVGMYDQLYEHVCNVHPGVAVQTTNRLSVTDVHEITSNRRRTYLVRSSYGMMWVLLSRASRSRIQAGLFLVNNTRGGRTSSPDNDRVADSPSPDILYRITWFDSVDDRSRTRCRCRTKEVNWSTALKEGCHTVLSSAYTMFRCRAGGRVEISWFRYSRRNNRQVQNNNSTA